MAFRNKTKSKLVIDERQTLDAKHNVVLANFNENKERLPELENQLAIIDSKLVELHELNAHNMVIDLNLQKKNIK